MNDISEKPTHEVDARILEEIVQQAEKRELLARRRAILYTLIPVLMALALVWYTSNRVLQAQQEVHQASQELAVAQSDLNEAHATLTPVVKVLATNQMQVEDSKEQLATAQMQITWAASDLAKQSEEITRLQREALSYKDQVQTLQTTAQAAQDRVYELDTLLKEATRFKEFTWHGDWEMTAKYLSGVSPAGDLFYRIMLLQQQNVPWNLNGFSISEGFNSPSFAAYMLTDMQMLLKPVTAPIAQAELLKLLPPKTLRPDSLERSPEAILRPGDLVYYKTGYTMFYFTDYDHQPFVIGMTPLGILALLPNFAEPIGYYPLFP